MDHNDYYQILKNYPKFVLKKDLKLKQVSNALKYIAPDIKENDSAVYRVIGYLRR